MPQLTRQQEKIFLFIQEVIAESGIPPTRAEIARALGFRSPNAAETHLRALQRRGVIELLPGASRGIQLKKGEAVSGDLLPLVGRVAAGAPVLAEQHIEKRYRIDSRLFRPRAHYLLRVYGMSMKDAGILDGDLVAVCRTPEVRNGQVVVARIEDEVTVKRYRQTGSTVWLVAENPDYAPIEINLEERSLVIEGVVVGVVRAGTPPAGSPDRKRTLP